MCYDYQTSITAWFISLFACLYMLANGDVYDSWIPLFILVYTQIQVMEAIIWVAMDKNPDINSTATKSISFLLWLQPFANAYIGYTQTHQPLLLALTAFFGFILLYHYFTTQNDTFMSTVGPNGHLVWNRYDQTSNRVPHLLGNEFLSIIYLIGLLLPFFYIKNNLMKYIGIIFTVITLGISFMNYQSEFSSMWCFFAVGLSFLALLFNTKA